MLQQQQRRLAMGAEIVPILFGIKAAVFLVFVGSQIKRD